MPLPPGLTPLFDGKTLTGWKQIPVDQWIVKEGALVSLGKGRGVIATEKSFGTYRVVFDIRHVSALPKQDHAACVLFFGSDPNAPKPADALAAVQFQVPQGWTWDYRPGHNNAGTGLFTSITKSAADPTKWSRVELLINATAGTAPGCRPAPWRQGYGNRLIQGSNGWEKRALSLQMHNAGLVDEYANIAIEEDPKVMDLITVK